MLNMFEAGRCPSDDSTRRRYDPGQGVASGPGHPEGPGAAGRPSALLSDLVRERHDRLLHLTRRAAEDHDMATQSQEAGDHGDR